MTCGPVQQRPTSDRSASGAAERVAAVEVGAVVIGDRPGGRVGVVPDDGRSEAVGVRARRASRDDVAGE